MKTYILFLLLWLSLNLAISNQTLNNSITTKPGCPAKCGNLTVPYPFGIGLGSGCSIGPPFDIDCNTSFNPPKAFTSKRNFEVININISDSKIRVKNQVAASRCYNEIGALILGKPDGHYDLETTPYSLSDENVLTSLGCDDFSLGLGVNLNITFACFAFCKGRWQLRQETCSGIGCCQSSILKGLKSIFIYMDSLSNHTEVWSFNPCGYSFLGEKDSYVFSSSDLSDPGVGERILEIVPLALDWVIDNQTCAEAKKSNNYTCQENSICFDSDIVFGGYRCSCSSGYEGNPYLSPGRQAINECESNPCDDENGICSNTPGSYNCSCREGYVGDGKKSGVGCIRLSSGRSAKLLVYSVVGSSIGLLLLLTVSFRLYKVVKKRQEQKCKQKFFKRNGGLLLQKQVSTNEGLVEKTRLFTAKELSKATDQFNESRILGRGGQGAVYKGMISDGRIVAVKKSKDIKSSNILLDENYKAKVSDFGISKSVSIDQTHLTTIVKGSFGYFDPKYFQSNQFTDKSDVYSFGVVLVELLSGQKPVSLSVAEDERSLVKRFLTSMEQNCLTKIIDPKISAHCKDEELGMAMEGAAITVHGSSGLLGKQDGDGMGAVKD
ncbi:wall-associated receptor kinase 2-like [Olea europaea subsp. europaea]|uniref:Wall-associated receptor kinase 2-like n=1 Tax=Olea europaea subsp. europaea TaxID=158383 RepID=A0A8S0VM98_OLEEU|nr:wall-associated receptor kinase 2-like [Olea europaea subsp. europaea]